MPCFLNLATLLPNPEEDSPLHDCSEILAETTAIRKDLTDVPLNNSELIWFTDGSSFIKDGQRKAGAAIVDDSGKIIWAEALPPGTSAQKAELLALIQALERAEGKESLFIPTVGMLAALYTSRAQYIKSGDFWTAEEKVKNLPKIRRLLTAVQQPRTMSIVHVPGHQKGRDIKAQGNRAADMVAHEAANRDCTAPILTVGLPPPGMGTLPPTPKYSSSDLN